MHSLTRTCSSTAFFSLFFSSARASIPWNSTHNPGQMHNDLGRSEYSFGMLFFPRTCRQEGSFQYVQGELPEFNHGQSTVSFTNSCSVPRHQWPLHARHQEGFLVS
ncbi:hypothetical protein CEXT_419841 [Caerostris extrusa]|uniref:Secreted protein n=1 Tax=Caerostris extrusa TaxID=172846 RepID=A0AAV4N6L6_CAEEX|nr:hypothetical protein CEXT_419841 [Caerostris extrusa]